MNPHTGIVALRPDAIRRRMTGDHDPRPQIHGDHALNPDDEPGPALRKAAVLIGLVAHPTGLTVLLTRRTDHLQHHPGQISFPGGHIEDHDANATAAALRETEEEIGLPTTRINIIGHLPPYITRTGFDITPVVALIAPPFDVIPDPREVAAVFEVPMAFLMDPQNHQRHHITIDGNRRSFHAMRYRDHFIWGATAGMIVQLYHHLGGGP